MRFMLALATVGLLLTQMTPSVNATELTLSDCIEKALENRAMIIQARGQEASAGATRLSALGAFLPHASASYNYSKSKTMDREYWTGDGPHTTGADQDGTSKSYGIGASMSVVDLSSWFNYFGAGANKAAASLNVLASEQDLTHSVKVYYYAYLAAVENVSVQEEAVKRSEEQLKLIESKFDLGSAALSDVLKQKVLFGNDRLSLLAAQNAEITSKADLLYTIGMDPTSEVTFASTAPQREFTGSLQEAIDEGLKSNPGLLSAKKSADAAGHYVRSAWATYLPTLSASARYNISDGTQGDTVTYNSSSKSYSYGFTVAFDIFDGFNRERSLSQAKISRNNALANLAEQRNAVAVDVKKAYLEIEKARQQKDVSQENVAAAEEDLKISQEKYNLGAATILDLLTAQESLKAAQVALIRAGFDLNLSIAYLENAMGKSAR